MVDEKVIPKLNKKGVIFRALYLGKMGTFNLW